MMKKNISRLVEEKKKEMDLIYFEKYSPLFNDAYRFLARKKALLYGGTALNELLPKSLKIYDQYTLPDVDVLSPDAKTLAADMVRFYKKNNHQAVSFTEALHPGTYKVYAEGVQIADITKCNIDTYKNLRKDCIYSKQWGVKIVPPQYLRMTLHKILSQPNDAHRWENVYERLQRYYKTFPIKNCSLRKRGATKQPSTQDKDIIIKKIYQLLPNENVVHFGEEEMRLLLDGDNVPLFQTPIQALTDMNLYKIAKTLKNEIHELTFSRVFTKDDFVGPHMMVYYKNEPVATFYKLSSCVAFNRYKNKKYASIHSLIDMFLSMSMSQYPHFKGVKPLLECLANKLAKHQQTSRSRKKLMEQFVLTCQGPSVGVATMRRERAKRINREKK